MEKSPQYYIEEPHRLDRIDYEDLLLHMEEEPIRTEWTFLTLLKQKYAFGRVDDELIHHLIAIENNKSTLQELLKIVQQFPTKSSLIASPKPDPASDIETETSVGEGDGVTAFPISEIPEDSPADEDSDPAATEEALPDSPEKEREKTLQEKRKKKKKRKKIRAEKENFLPESSETSERDRPEEESDEEGNFLDWLKGREVLPGTARELKQRKKGIKRKKLRKAKMSEAEKQAAKSVEENEELVSETLANLYVQQALYEKAVQMYEKLKLKFPNKSGYFASKIENIKNLNS